MATTRVKNTASLKRKLRAAQRYWRRKAKQKGILTERDLERYLRR